MIIYYGVIKEGTERTPESTCVVEPVRVEGQEQIGREPDFCCKTMQESYEGYDFQVTCWRMKEPIMNLCSRFGSSSFKQIFYCPYCGKEIKFKSNTKLRAIERQRPITESWYEEI